MNTVDNTANTTFESLGLTRPPKEKTARLGQEQFLELMVAQLKNQDPFKPLQSGEFLGQLAQFSTVSGIQDLQSSFRQVSNAISSNQALQASSLVGRTVLAPGEAGTLAPGGTLSGAADLTSATDELVVGVYDASGQLIRRLSLGSQAAGLVPFAWDGLDEGGRRAAPGVYHVKAQARLDGKSTALSTLMASRVNSVTLGKSGEGITLNLDGLGAVDFSQVRQIM